MLMSGRWGFSSYCLRRSDSLIKDVTPGKLVSKKGIKEDGSADKEAKCEAGRKRVQVKDLSRDGIAMNMYSLPGQMCR